MGAAEFKLFEFNTVKEAWENYQQGNGCGTISVFEEKVKLINNGETIEPGKEIGSIILSNVVFFDPSDWIDEPSDWSKEIVQGKTYNTVKSAEASEIQDEVTELIKKNRIH